MLNIALWKNYLQAGLRNARKHLLQSSMNVLGLVLGMGASLVIIMYAVYEMSYDDFHPRSEDTYRVAIDLPDIELGGDGIALTPDGVKEYLQNMGGHNVRAATRILPADTFYKLFNGQNELFGTQLVAGDADITDVFQFNFADGSAERLEAPNTMIVSQRFAERFFSDSNDVIGKKLYLDGTVPVEIVGIFNGWRNKSHIVLDSIVSMATLKAHSPGIFMGMRGNNFHTYVNVADAGELDMYAASLSDVLSANMKVEVNTFFQPLTDINLHSSLLGEFKPNNDFSVVLLSIALALGLLLIACFNFINMTTAHASVRAKEVGVRKSLGASRNDLFWQFMSETALLVCISTVIVAALLQAFLQMINASLGVELQLDMTFWLVLLILSVLLIVTAGAYPAVFISRYQISSALRGEDTLEQLGKGGSRKILVFIQSVLTVSLLILTFIVSSQINHIENIETGYEREAVLLSPRVNEEQLVEAYDGFKTRLQQIPEVGAVTRGEQVPTMAFNDSLRDLSVSGSDVSNLEMTPIVGVGYDYVKTFEMKLLAGRDFSQQYSGDWVYRDEQGIDNFGTIVNKSFTQLAGWQTPEQAVGQYIFTESVQGRIVGVIDDVMFRSATTPSQPFVLALGYSSQGRGTIAVKLNSVSDRQAQWQIEGIFEDAFNVQESHFESLEQRFNDLHSELRLQIQILYLFTLLIILLTLLGMFGLAKFSAERRIQELAIRRIVGASKFQLINMLSLDFVKVVAIASMVAWPFAWYLCREWLQTFAYSVSVGPLFFVLASIITLALSWITVSAVSYQSTRLNPVDALKRD